MSDLRLLTDQELIDASRELRCAALKGSNHALFEARRHETELRRRFCQVERDGWSTSSAVVAASGHIEPSMDEPVTLTTAVQQFLLATADSALPLVRALSNLLRYVRVILQMDIAYVDEFVDGN